MLAVLFLYRCVQLLFFCFWRGRIGGGFRFFVFELVRIFEPFFWRSWSGRSESQKRKKALHGGRKRKLILIVNNSRCLGSSRERRSRRSRQVHTPWRNYSASSQARAPLEAPPTHEPPPRLSEEAGQRNAGVTITKRHAPQSSPFPFPFPFTNTHTHTSTDHRRRVDRLAGAVL